MKDGTSLPNVYYTRQISILCTTFEAVRRREDLRFAVNKINKKPDTVMTSF